jgi:hypothetical protein
MCLSNSPDVDSMSMYQSSSHGDSFTMGPPCQRACMPAVSKSVHASRVKERACRTQLQNHKMKIACLRVCPTHQMWIACRCTSRVHTVILSRWAHRVKERACQPCQRACMSNSTSESQDEDSMLMCLSNSPDVDSMSMCQSSSHGDSVTMGPPCQRACMPAVSKSVHASRVKERACHPCLNGDVHVKLNFRVTR